MGIESYWKFFLEDYQPKDVDRARQAYDYGVFAGAMVLRNKTLPSLDYDQAIRLEGEHENILSGINLHPPSKAE